MKKYEPNHVERFHYAIHETLNIAMEISDNPDNVDAEKIRRLSNIVRILRIQYKKMME